MYFLFPLAVM